MLQRRKRDGEAEVDEGLREIWGILESELLSTVEDEDRFRSEMVDGMITTTSLHSSPTRSATSWPASRPCKLGSTDHGAACQ